MEIHYSERQCDLQSFEIPFRKDLRQFFLFSLSRCCCECEKCEIKIPWSRRVNLNIVARGQRLRVFQTTAASNGKRWKLLRLSRPDWLCFRSSVMTNSSRSVQSFIIFFYNPFGIHIRYSVAECTLFDSWWLSCRCVWAMSSNDDTSLCITK